MTPAAAQRSPTVRSPFVVVFLGPPGAGKGTQAKAEAEARDLLYVATGDALRSACARGTDMGLQAKRYMDAGELVPDDVIIGLVREILEESPDGQGVLFDGFPRTIGQAEALDRLLADRGGALAGILYFDVPAEAVVARLGGRRVCRKCGATYHIEHLPPRVEGQCDSCPDGGELYQRDDDKPETVHERLRVYHEQTAALLDYYTARGLLVRIDADQSIPDVREAMQAAINVLAA